MKKQPECLKLSDGSKTWILNGNLHREDGPAIEYSDGTKQWWLNGQRHRTDGPAMEYYHLLGLLKEPDDMILML